MDWTDGRQGSILSCMSSPSLCASCTARPAPIARGTPAYRRVNVALFLAGFATFSLLYCVQPLMPEFAAHFGLTPAASSMALSLSTGALALAIVVAGALSQQLSRRGLMFGSMASAALLNLVAACAPDWPLLLAARTLEGLALGGVPAVAMAYLAEEIDPRHLGGAMGLYVAGTAFGGMMGRVGMGLLVELGTWRMAMGSIGALGLLAAFGFAMLLPASRQFTPRRGFIARLHVDAWRGHLADGGLRRLYAVGFLLTSAFVALFNYIGFRLAAPPYALAPAQIGLVFLAYVLGMFASSAGGRLAERFGGRGPLAGGMALLALGIAVTLARPLPLVMLGIALATIGYFVAHAVASGWVGRLAAGHKGHASSLYLLAYYLGSSLTGSVGGWFWVHGGWPAEVALTGGLALLGAWVAWTLRSRGGARG